MKFPKNLALSSLVFLQISTTLYANGDQQLIPYSGATHPEYEKALQQQAKRAAEKRLPEDLKKLAPPAFNSILSYLDLSYSQLVELSGPNRLCRGAISHQDLARARIHQLIGKLITVEAGAFEYRPSYSIVTRLVNVDHAFQMPENDLSQEQYDLIASKMEGMPTAAQAMNPYGNIPNLVGPKKPIGGLTEPQRQRYLTRLNQALAILWPVAYPGQSVPVMRLPEENELRLAMSDPLRNEEQTSFADGTRITAKFTTYSGANVPIHGDLTVEQVLRLRSHVVYGRQYEEGPKDVDDSSIHPNQRGFRSLSGNIRKSTSTPAVANGVYRVTTGSRWNARRHECHSDLLDNVHPEHDFNIVGLRLARTIP